MLRLRLLLIGLFLLVLARAGSAEVITVGALSVDWPAGTTVKSGRPPVELAMPGGAKVLVTVLSFNGKPPAPDAAKLLASQEGVLTELAKKAGRVVLPLAIEALPGGNTLLSIGSETGLLGGGYLLQYAVLNGNQRMGYFSVEGRGEVLARHEAFKPLFQRAQWDMAEGTEAERDAFTQKVATLFRARLGVDVKVDSPLTLKVGALQANLDRVYGYCRTQAAACDEELDRFVQTLKETLARADDEAPPARAAVRLVVRTEEYAAALNRSARQADTPEKQRDSEPLAQPFVDGLVVLPVLDSENSVRLFNRSDAQAMKLLPAEVHALGLANLRAAFGPLVAKPVAPGGIRKLEGDIYESSRLLLDADWAALARAQGGVLIVALPVKDALLYTADDSPAGLAALHRFAREVTRNSPAPLSDVLLRWTEAGWQVAR